MCENKTNDQAAEGEDDYEFDDFICDLWEFAGKWVDDKMAALAGRAAELYEDETAVRIVQLHADAQRAYKAARHSRFYLLARCGKNDPDEEEYVGMLADKAHQWSEVMYELFLA